MEALPTLKTQLVVDMLDLEWVNCVYLNHSVVVHATMLGMNNWQVDTHTRALSVSKEVSERLVVILSIQLGILLLVLALGLH